MAQESTGRGARPEQPERRALARVTLAKSFAVARFTHIDQLEPAAELLATDITAGGIRLLSRRGLNPGDRAVIQMVSGEGIPSLVGITIIHAAPAPSGGYTLGAQFTTLPERLVRRALLLADGSLIDLRAAG